MTQQYNSNRITHYRRMHDTMSDWLSSCIPEARHQLLLELRVSKCIERDALAHVPVGVLNNDPLLCGHTAEDGYGSDMNLWFMKGAAVDPPLVGVSRARGV